MNATYALLYQHQLFYIAIKQVTSSLVNGSNLYTHTILIISVRFVGYHNTQSINY
jgi:hypothetical protein